MPLAGCGTSLLATAAWLLLPYGVWVRLAAAARLPRYLGHVCAKTLVVCGLPPPPGVAAYMGGTAVRMEGIMLPGA